MNIKTMVQKLRNPSMVKATKKETIACYSITALVLLVLGVTMFMDTPPAVWIAIASAGLFVAGGMLMYYFKRKLRSTAAIVALLAAAITLSPLALPKVRAQTNPIMVCIVVIVSAVGVYAVYKCAKRYHDQQLPQPPGAPPQVTFTNGMTVNFSPPPYLLPGTNWHPAWSNFFGGGGEWSGAWVLVPDKRHWWNRDAGTNETTIRFQSDNFWTGPFLPDAYAASNAIPSAVMGEINVITNAASPGVEYANIPLQLQGSTDLVTWLPYVAEVWQFPDGSTINRLSWSNLTITVNYAFPGQPPPAADDYEIAAPLGGVDGFFLRLAR
jgi:hypothetical protein